jgi:peptidoglycan/xylan/chitin deacetylase (PgdA/CDA1 family)
MGFGVMFHHFHSQSHLVRPGSISSGELDELLSHLKREFSILGPETFLAQLLDDTLKKTDILLSFDDSLLSQFDVAIPVLDAHSIKGLFNVYSSVFTGEPDPLELFAIYRASEFENFDDYWSRFLDVVEQLKPGTQRMIEESFPSAWLSNFPFYSVNERKFRFLRDRLISKEEYLTIMFELISQSTGFSSEKAIKDAWMQKEHLQLLLTEGHSVGLHSHTHPTQMADLPEEEQRAEYVANKDWIESQLMVTPTWVAHPCGNYSETTLKILDDLGVQGGVRSSLTPGFYGSPLEVPREDHANIMKELQGR